MTRILADLPDDDIKWLDRLAEEQGKSRAAVLREAVGAFRSANADWLERGFGLWTCRPVSARKAMESSCRRPLEGRDNRIVAGSFIRIPCLVGFFTKVNKNPRQWAGDG